MARDHEIARVLRKQHKAFRKKFGRDPLPHEPVFFDPAKERPEPLAAGALESDVLEAMKRANIPPEIIFAYLKTGLLLSEENAASYSPDVRAEWQAAIDEYFRLEQQGGRDN